ncbi:MAG TPA: DUF4339 domain-containing protein [Chthoniobacteraceae bacterium]|nr:DUF4339 domain-containing protein [Chthoniobacteraceae bacterium]
MAFNEEFFIHIQGEQKGPYTYPQLKRMYENSLIPEETLYWRDGMEQMEPVSDLCGSRKRDHLRRLRRIRTTAIIVLAAAAMVTAYFAPMLREGWREMNDRDQTQEAAYWRARGFVREAIRRQDESVVFDPYTSASVSLTGTSATVILPGTVLGKGKTTWRVAMQYDIAGREWKCGDEL